MLLFSLIEIDFPVTSRSVVSSSMCVFSTILSFECQVPFVLTYALQGQRLPVCNALNDLLVPCYWI